MQNQLEDKTGNKDKFIIISLAVSGLLLLFIGRFFSFLIIIAVILLLSAYLLFTMQWQSKFLDKIFRKNKRAEGEIRGNKGK